MEFRFTIIDPVLNTEVEIDEPIGWDKCKFTLARDENFHGIFVTFSTDLEFVGTGYTIIKDTFYNSGIEYVLTLRIEERCNASYEYETMFTGRINLSRFQDLFNGYCSCKVNLEDTTNSMLIKNNADKLINFSETIEIEGETLAPLEENEMAMHSKAIVLTSVFDTIQYPTPLTSERIITNSGLTYYFAMPVFVESNDLSISASTGATAQIQSTATILQSDIETNFVPAYSGTYELHFECTGSFTDDVTTLAGRDYALTWVYSINGNISVYTISSLGVYDPEQPLIVNFDINETASLSLTAGDQVKIYLVLASYNAPTNTVVNWYLSFDTANIYFKSETVAPATTAKTYMIHECFERVAQATIDKQTAFESNFLGRKDIGYGANGCGSFTALTNGFNIRNFDKPILTTLTDIFNSLSAIHCLGLGLMQKGDNEVIKVEPVDYFYDSDNQIAEMLNIKQISVSSNESMIYNTALIGFEKFGTEEGTDKNNILDGFATQHNYNLPITTVKKAFVKVCKYITDHYAIEFTRRQQLINTSTQSWKFDDDNFLICTNRTENVSGIATSLNVAEKNENFSATNNILSPETGYNLRLTPTRMLLKWNQLLSGAYAKITGVSAKFANGISNYLYQSQLNGSCTDRYNNQILSENQNLAWDDSNNDINAPIVEPISIKYSYPMTSQLFNNILANPSGYISCSKGSTIEHRGFIKMLTFTPTEGMAEIELIRMFGNESPCDLVYVECPYVESEYVE